MFIFKIITYLAGAVTLGLCGYLYKLLDESGYLQQVAAVPADEIMTYHIIAAVVIIWLLIGLVMKVISRAILITLLVIAVGAEGMFAGLNISGDIVEQSAVVEQLEDSATKLFKQAQDLVE